MSQYSFKFAVGGRVLFSVRRPVRDICARLIEILEQRVPPVPLRPGQGLIYRSLPVSALDAVPYGSDVIVYEKERFPRHYTVFSGDFDSYLNSMSANARSSLRRKVRAFEKYAGTLNVREHRTPSEVAAFLPLARALSKRTYQDRLLEAGLPDTDTFTRRSMESAERDQLRAYMLFDQDRPVSYLYAPADEDVLIYEYQGYDPEYANYSVGGVLQFEVMRRLFAEQRWRYFDFTPGEGQHKRQFATGQVECLDLVILPKSAANTLLVSGHRGFNGMVERAGSYAERKGLKARFRRLLRGQT